MSKLEQYPFKYSHDNASGEGTVDATSKKEAYTILEKGIKEQGDIKNLKIEIGDAVAPAAFDPSAGVSL